MRIPVMLGVSVAASWAWGTSLIVGMEIARQKGLGAWLIWAVANAGTLAVFGALTRTGFLARHVFDKKPIKIAALAIQVFCLVIQLNIIYKVLIEIGLTGGTSYGIASAVGIIFTGLMYRQGLRTSILTDLYQWFIAIGAIVGIIILGVLTTAENTIYPASSGGDLLWGVWSACILLAGPIGDVQHWQRAEFAGRSKAFTYGALFFAAYMALVLAMSYFTFSPEMNVILLLAVLCITSSTIDSIAVAMHEIANKRVGTCVALFICLSWGVFADIGIIELWSKAGVYRVGFAIVILSLAVYSVRKRKREAEHGIRKSEAKRP